VSSCQAGWTLQQQQQQQKILMMMMMMLMHTLCQHLKLLAVRQQHNAGPPLLLLPTVREGQQGWHLQQWVQQQGVGVG
jgi:hypothetical protein